MYTQFSLNSVKEFFFFKIFVKRFKRIWNLLIDQDTYDMIKRITILIMRIKKNIIGLLHSQH